MTTNTEDFEMGRLTVTVGKASDIPSVYTLEVDRLAARKDGEMYLLSVVGPAGAVKGLRACMNANVTVELALDGLHVEDDSGRGGRANAVRREAEKGYALSLVQLGHGHYHALFTSRQPGFLRTVDDESLFAALTEPVFTTPILRAWVGPIAAQLKDAGLLVPLYGFRCRCALLTATTFDLDAIVSAGVQDGTLRFEEFAIA